MQGETAREKQRRKATATSVPNTAMGKGYTVEEDLLEIKAHEAAEAQKQAEKAAKAADREA